MRVYVVYKPYSDDILGVYSDGKDAYKKAFELSKTCHDGDISYEVIETNIIQPKEVV